MRYFFLPNRANPKPVAQHGLNNSMDFHSYCKHSMYWILFPLSQSDHEFFLMHNLLDIQNPRDALEWFWYIQGQEVLDFRLCTFANYFHFLKSFPVSPLDF